MAVSESFVLRAIEYAKQRWCLDDPALVCEYCEEQFRSGDTPGSLIDDFAEAYELVDPKDLEWGRPRIRRAR
jgi:hypothetical protein